MCWSPFLEKQIINNKINKKTVGELHRKNYKIDHTAVIKYFLSQNWLYHEMGKFQTHVQSFKFKTKLLRFIYNNYNEDDRRH